MPYMPSVQLIQCKNEALKENWTSEIVLDCALTCQLAGAYWELFGSRKFKINPNKKFNKKGISLMPILHCSLKITPKCLNHFIVTFESHHAICNTVIVIMLYYYSVGLLFTYAYSIQKCSFYSFMKGNIWRKIKNLHSFYSELKNWREKNQFVYKLCVHFLTHNWIFIIITNLCNKAKNLENVQYISTRC